MNAPRLMPMNEVARRADLAVAKLPLLLPEGARPWVVVDGGVFQGREFRRGDVLVFGTSEEADAAVLLVPRGRGAVRLGRRTEGGLWGAYGEPCSAERFEVQGHLVRVLRARPEGQVAARVAGAPARTAHAARPERVGQLGLFARAAC